MASTITYSTGPAMGTDAHPCLHGHNEVSDSQTPRLEFDYVCGLCVSLSIWYTAPGLCRLPIGPSFNCGQNWGTAAAAAAPGGADTLPASTSFESLQTVFLHLLRRRLHRDATCC